MTNLLEIGLTNAVLATALALGVWLVTRFWRQPVFVHALWVIVLLKLITPPLLSVPWQLSQPLSLAKSHSDVAPSVTLNESDLVEPAFDTVADAEFATRPISETRAASPVPLVVIPMESQAPDASRHALSWVTVVTGVWLAGSALFLTIAVGRLLRFHIALYDAASAPKELRELASEVAKRFGFAGGYRLRVTDGRLPPLVWPIGRPTIVLSRQLLAELSPDETQTLLAHEFAHLRRKDPWVRWLELVAATMYWWHPVVWWARTMIRRTEEQACDAWVVWAFPGTAKRYASALFTAIEFISDCRPAPPLVASRLDAGGQLKERIENVMSGNLNHRLSIPIRILLLVVAVAILPLSFRAVQAADEEPAAQDTPSDGAANTATPLPTFELRKAQTADSSIELRLETPVTVQFIDMPLEEALDSLSNTIGIDIYLDPRGLDQEGISIDVPVTVRLKNKISAKSAMNLVLEPLHLNYVIEDEVIKVTSKQVAAASRKKDRYRIAPGDLLKIAAVGVSPDAPIADAFVVEPSGTVALGPVYGRVEVAGLTIEQAEKATRDLLKLQFREPVVQITLGRPQRDGAVAAEEHVDRLSRDDSNLSIGVLKKLVEGQRLNYERQRALEEKNVVSANELERARSSYEAQLARLEQAQRALKYNQLLVELAETEYQEAVQKNNKAGAGAVTNFELQKLRLKVELAKAKLSELAE